MNRKAIRAPSAEGYKDAKILSRLGRNNFPKAKIPISRTSESGIIKCFRSIKKITINTGIRIKK